jgi:hypothetical protein
MDLNYLLRRHQISLMRADAATCDPSRLSHEGLAGLYADAVDRHQEQKGGAIAVGRPTRADLPADASR